MKNVAPLTLIFLLTLLAASCGGSKPEKYFAQGDGFDPTNFGEIDAAAAKKPQREVSIPANKSEEAGLGLTVTANRNAVNAGGRFFFTITVRNTTLNSKTIAYTSEKRFDLAIFSDPDQRSLVYLHSEGTYYAELFQETVLSGGANTKRVLEVATEAPREGDNTARDLAAPLLPGKYWVYATHEGTPLLGTGPLEIEVLDPETATP